MARFLHPLLLLVARATELELAGYVEYLKAENRILRSKLPKRVQVTEAERERLVKLGRPVGPAIKELITIVTPRTFARWASEATAKPTPRKPGRPRKPEEVRELIVQMAKDNSRGSKRILGELKKLGIRKISRATVSRILKEYGFDPGPKRGEGTWHDFVQRHMKTLRACDCFTSKVWTLGGLVEYYVFFFIHIETRRVHVAGMTPNPDGPWMAQQARNLCMFFDEQADRRPTHIVRDRDSKFTPQFCSIVESEGIEFRPIPPYSPNMNPFAEAWVQRIKRERLDHFLVLGKRHLCYLIQDYLTHYHEERPHQGIGNRPPNQIEPAQERLRFEIDEIVCHERLGGLLRHYEPKAA
ncbi:MAG: integrase core domain-containing protein [Pirellulaceae bacterium]